MVDSINVTDTDDALGNMTLFLNEEFKLKCPTIPSPVHWRTKVLKENERAQQDNTDDCGVFTILYFKLHTRDMPLTSFSKNSIDKARYMILLELLEGKILFDWQLFFRQESQQQ